MFTSVRPGSLTEVYTSAVVKAGSVWIDPSNGKKYIFLLNAGSSAISAKECAITSDASAYSVTLNTTLNSPSFAGVRVSGATDVAQNEYGWFQIGGNATCIFGDSALTTTAGQGVVLDDDSDGGRIGGGDYDVSATVNETTVEATTNAILGTFGIAQATVNTTDADVEVQITKNIWGV